jgi:hypothetical protein
LAISTVRERFCSLSLEENGKDAFMCLGDYIKFGKLWKIEIREI